LILDLLVISIVWLSILSTMIISLEIIIILSVLLICSRFCFHIWLWIIKFRH